MLVAFAKTAFVLHLVNKTRSVVKGELRVTVGERVYSSDQYMATKHNYAYVPDANLLCKFVATEVDEDTLKAAAQEVEKEKSELERLRAQVTDLELSYRNLDGANEILRAENEALGAKSQRMWELEACQAALIALVKNINASGIFRRQSAIDVAMAKVREIERSKK